MARGKSQAAAASGKKTAIKPKRKVPERGKNHKTAKDPFEAANPDEDYEVEAVLAEKYDGSLKCHGSPAYLGQVPWSCGVLPFVHHRGSRTRQLPAAVW